MSFSTFFSNLQEAPWYRQFLNPILDEVDNDSILLDIGTGSGKMLEILSKEKKVTCIGTDTNQEMLDEAKVKLKGTDTQLHLIPAGRKLPFEEGKFDAVTICSVLFHMKEEDIDNMLEDSMRVLKKGGKIIILTPTGKGNIFKLSNHYFSFKNKTIYVWYKSTKNRAKIWGEKEYLKAYSTKKKLKYHSQIVMNGFAQVEILYNKQVN